MKKSKKTKIYLTYINYSATGEGSLVELCVVYANKKSEAIHKHKWNMGTDEYYMFDISCFELKSKEAKRILEHYFNNNDDLMYSIVNGLQEFQFKFKYNLS